jgi:serine/threonine protein kinase
MNAIELVPGTLIAGGYRLVRRLGEGGMGVVWEAERTDGLQRVAVKLLKETGADPDACRRLLREARAASTVDHPNVVRVLDVLELVGDSPAIVMELLEGESLSEELRRRGRLGLRELADILAPVTSAVGAAHALGIVHRDLKPENIFLSRRAGSAIVPKVLDFGIAKLIALDGEAARSTGITTGVVLGTPTYMAPEQLFGEKDVDHRADIWALGLIIYRCLSGVLPTDGANLGQVMKNVVAKPFDPLERIVRDVPPAVASLVARMLARERAHRPADLHEVIDVLNQFASAPGQTFGPPNRRSSVGFEVRTDRAITSPRLGRSKRWAVLGSAAAVALLGMSVARWKSTRTREAAPSHVAAAALFGSGSTKIACPILSASGVDEPSGWLGAAAAATVCERARVIRGGSPERTLVPAELLGLSRRPTDDFPADPYTEARARERSLAEARRRGAPYLDGAVAKDGTGFTVTLSLHRPDGEEVAMALGRGRALYQAVRAAMEPLVTPERIPKASALDPDIGDWTRAHDVDAALALLDVSLAMAHNAGGLPEECSRLDQWDVAEMRDSEKWRCAYMLGLPAPSVPIYSTDPAMTNATFATRVRINHFIHRTDRPEDAEALEERFKRDPTSWGQSLLAATESCLLQSSDPNRAREMANLAVISEPKNPDGQLCDPWGQLLTMAWGTPSEDSVVRAMLAWVPWDGTVWRMKGLGAKSSDAALPALWRAYTLKPFDAHVASDLVDRLLMAGDRERARTISSEVSIGDQPVHRAVSALLRLRVEASEAQFGAALTEARKALEISSNDAGWVRALRFDVAWRALELAEILGREKEFADLLVERFLDPEPSLLDGSILSVPQRVPAICAIASAPVSVRCFQRFQSLRGRLSGGITEDTDNLVRGAERYARGDLEGAAKAWRPLLRGPGTLASELPAAMVKSFEHTHDIDLAERVDEAAKLRAREFNGATLGHVRMARRAFARGDREKAATLAREVVEAWSVADETVPSVNEMRLLLSRLPDGAAFAR